MSEGRLVAIVPAWNESGAIGGVVDEIRAFDARIDVVVVDDASSDDTASVARAHGATVLALPFNVGIGGAVQTGFRYARDEGYEVAVRLDGDGQHDASELGKLLGPIRAGDADFVVGSRFVDPGGTYRPPFARQSRDRRLRTTRLPARRAARDRHDLRLRRAQPRRNRALRRRVSARLPRGGGARSSRCAAGYG